MSGITGVPSFTYGPLQRARAPVLKQIPIVPTLLAEIANVIPLVDRAVEDFQRDALKTRPKLILVALITSLVVIALISCTSCYFGLHDIPKDLLIWLSVYTLLPLVGTLIYYGNDLRYNKKQIAAIDRGNLDCINHEIWNQFKADCSRCTFIIDGKEFSHCKDYKKIAAAVKKLVPDMSKYLLAIRHLQQYVQGYSTIDYALKNADAHRNKIESGDMVRRYELQVNKANKIFIRSKLDLFCLRESEEGQSVYRESDGISQYTTELDMESRVVTLISTQRKIAGTDKPYIDQDMLMLNDPGGREQSQVSQHYSSLSSDVSSDDGEVDPTE